MSLGSSHVNLLNQLNFLTSLWCIWKMQSIQWTFNADCAIVKLLSPVFSEITLLRICPLTVFIAILKVFVISYFAIICQTLKTTLCSLLAG